METVKSLFCDDMTKEWLRNVLSNGSTTVEFLKKDGTNRVMKCTLDANLIPSANLPKGDGVARKVSTDSLAVFDLDKNEWRSFRYDSVLSVTFGE